MSRYNIFSTLKKGGKNRVDVYYDGGAEVKSHTQGFKMISLWWVRIQTDSFGNVYSSTCKARMKNEADDKGRTHIRMEGGREGGKDGGREGKGEEGGGGKDNEG